MILSACRAETRLCLQRECSASVESSTKWNWGDEDEDRRARTEFVECKHLDRAGRVTV